MVELKITGNNYKEIKKQIFELANDIATDSDDSIEIQPASVRQDTPVVKSFTPPSMMTNTQDQSQVVTQTEAPKRSRRSKAEIEAERVAKLQASQAEVAQAQASHQVQAPITIPQVPTTQHVVSIPTAHLVEQAPVQRQAQEAQHVIQQPVAPQTQTVPGGYTLATFKQNLVMILNGLLSTGKLNSAWISDTSNQIFGGADIWLWSQNEAKIAELFGMFIEWGFIQEFKG